MVPSGPPTGQLQSRSSDRRDTYDRELAAYRRLADQGVSDVLGHHVPQLLRFDAVMLVIDVTIVHPLFLLDFASAWLDQPPGFGEEVLEEWLEEKLEQFAERWPHVATVLAELERYGIHLMDIHPGNITFAEANA